MLKVESLSYKIGNRTIINGVTISLRRGELLAITGANGAGKSTLISLLNGEKTAASGKIMLDGKSVQDYEPEELARKRATLSQHNAVNMAFSVEEIVMMGRYPYFTGKAREADQIAVSEAISVCGLTTFAERSYLKLSGGEQQRVQLARILAQLWDQPGGLLLLDEPIAGLDLLYQQQTLAIAKALTRKGFMVIAVLHELNLAAQYADRILMLKDGRRWKDGSPAEVLTALDIYSVFGLETEVVMSTKTLTPYIIAKEIRLAADEFNSMIVKEIPVKSQVI
ncbi:heme ABC transporter ATP-binding protein [Pedobacter metabolipauper]|uniref:Iron complex transport system ATP-binding protein n=1 Tax=Pedobacter metabolipauper TaxID=425513 RepID=A0A4R6SWK8_9SPHI|nr:heme ABC transporter ATP-binding protein [Pedobacter metabolipauper]TDQ09776.1 iron complex transport system ATP-binding protein [Pedobacter metabolipauper]